MPPTEFLRSAGVATAQPNSLAGSTCCFHESPAEYAIDLPLWPFLGRKSHWFTIGKRTQICSSPGGFNIASTSSADKEPRSTDLQNSFVCLTKFFVFYGVLLIAKRKQIPLNNLSQLYMHDFLSAPFSRTLRRLPLFGFFG